MIEKISIAEKQDEKLMVYELYPTDWISENYLTELLRLWINGWSNTHSTKGVNEWKNLINKKWLKKVELVSKTKQEKS